MTLFFLTGLTGLAASEGENEKNDAF